MQYMIEKNLKFLIEQALGHREL